MDLKQIRKMAGVESNRPGLQEDVARVILQQMGGLGRLQAMLGAKNFTSTENSVQFRWPNKERARGNAVKITLQPSDTYDMEFFNLSGSSAKSVKKYDDIYADKLVDVFEKQTGWFLSIGGAPKISGSKPTPEVDPSHVTTKSDLAAAMASGVPFWTVSSMDGVYNDLESAKRAWHAAGSPKEHGSSVWASQHKGGKTLQTVTLDTKQEGKALEALRALVNEGGRMLQR